MRTVDLALGERSYTIHIDAGLIGRAGAIIAPRLPAPRVTIVSNPVVAAHWLAPLKDGLAAAGIAHDAILVPDGEVHKDFATLADVLARMLAAHAERTTSVVALGGGVIGDLAGFAAAVYQRGVPFVQIPTTLLAQVDSSVGGKTGINHALGKNMIGAFHQPLAVLIDTDCLRTLPERELNAGLAEVIKYGAIRDAEFFDWLERRIGALRARDAGALTHAIERSCALKAEIVARDERESGERALLNFGHTFGHAIETATGYGAWLHGEAVGAGMVMASRLSARLRAIADPDVERMRALVAAAGLPVEAPALGAARYLELMRRDKKVSGGAIRFVLLDRIGAARVRADVPQDALESVLP